MMGTHFKLVKSVLLTAAVVVGAEGLTPASDDRSGQSRVGGATTSEKSPTVVPEKTKDGKPTTKEAPKDKVRLADKRYRRPHVKRADRAKSWRRGVDVPATHLGLDSSRRVIA
jgi:hypothetical protein